MLVPGPHVKFVWMHKNDKPTDDGLPEMRSLSPTRLIVSA